MSAMHGIPLFRAQLNPFQSNFSANCILPSSYLCIPAIFLQAQQCEYNAQSPFHIKSHGLSRNRKSTTCAICWPKSVLHEEKRRTGSNSRAGATKSCRTSSDIGVEQENHNVGQGPTWDRKGLSCVLNMRNQGALPSSHLDCDQPSLLWAVGNIPPHRSDYA